VEIDDDDNDSDGDDNEVTDADGGVWCQVSW